jgi:hypothetical protein
LQANLVARHGVDRNVRVSAKTKFWLLRNDSPPIFEGD